MSGLGVAELAADPITHTTTSSALLFVALDNALVAMLRRFYVITWISVLLYVSQAFQVALHPRVQRSTVRRCAQRTEDPIRLNKIFKATHSRREADRMIQEGRVTVNGEVSYGTMVVPFQDVVALDGNVVQGWERMNGISNPAPEPQQRHENINSTFEYVKYYKPRGVICTTDRRIKGNIIDALTKQSGYRPKHRVYPVGRLDKDSSGLILITSDGRLPNASLRRQQKQPKVYRVTVKYPLSDDDLEDLRSGILITTVAQRDGTSKPLTAKTKPCIVTSYGPRRVEIILEEGRNRQIRKMMAKLDNEVVTLHRVRFGKIGLDDDMLPGDWKELSLNELEWIQSLLEPV